MSEAEALIIAAGIALAGVIIAGALARGLATREARREHDRWLRNERLAAYTRFLAEMDRYRVLLTDRRHGKVSMREFVTSTTEAIAPVQLLGPDLPKMMAEVLHGELAKVLTNPKHPMGDYRAARVTFIEVAEDTVGAVSRGRRRQVKRAKAGKRVGPVGRVWLRVHGWRHRWDHIDLT